MREEGQSISHAGGGAAVPSTMASTSGSAEGPSSDRPESPAPAEDEEIAPEEAAEATAGRKRNLLRQIINPGRCKLSELQGSLERHELLVQRYERTRDA